jgi:hypothetical protein
MALFCMYNCITTGIACSSFFFITTVHSCTTPAPFQTRMDLFISWGFCGCRHRHLGVGCPTLSFFLLLVWCFWGEFVGADAHVVTLVAVWAAFE